MRLCYSLVLFMALIMLTAGISVISGCGKKGVLYLPSEAQQKEQQKKAQAAKKQTPTTTTTPKP